MYKHHIFESDVRVYKCEKTNITQSSLKNWFSLGQPSTWDVLIYNFNVAILIMHFLRNAGHAAEDTLFHPF